MHFGCILYSANAPCRYINVYSMSGSNDMRAQICSNRILCHALVALNHLDDAWTVGMDIAVNNGITHIASTIRDPIFYCTISDSGYKPSLSVHKQWCRKHSHKVPYPGIYHNNNAYLSEGIWKPPQIAQFGMHWWHSIVICIIGDDVSMCVRITFPLHTRTHAWSSDAVRSKLAGIPLVRRL